MKILDNYIGRTVLSSTLMTLLILAGISGLFRFIEQLKSVGKGDYDALHAALFTMYSLPTDIEVFFPMAALIGGLVGLGALASHSELIVMQAAGLSRFNIVQSVMKAALVMVVLVMVVGEWVAPEAQKKARQIKAQAISGGSLISAQQGVWAKDGASFVHIGVVEDTGRLDDVTIYKFTEDLILRGVTHAVSANYGVVEKDSWLLEGVTELMMEPERITKTVQTSLSWSSSLTPDKLGVVTIRRPEYLAISDLVDYLDYLKGNKQDAGRYQLAFWRKVLQPVTIAVMLFMALSFIFGPLRSVTMGARILLGIITGFAFYMTNQIFGPIALVYRLPPIVGALLPSLLFVGVSVYFIRQRN
ncbi:MAG: lipopolysaccharide export system permease protein [Phenylobacterium sp.]|jgi:lipopolysaccharide export system permease protein